MPASTLRVVTVGADRVDRDVDTLRGALATALAGGPAIAVVPEPGPAVPAALAARVRAAVAPDAPLEDARTCAVITTSGSTGDPLGVCHSASTLRAAAASFARAYPELSGAPWILALPPTSAAGFAVVLRATVEEAPLVPLASLGGAQRFTPGGFADAVAAARGTPPVAALVPRQLQVLLDDPQGIDALGSCALVLVGGGATRTTLASGARAAGIALRTTYGMTETCGGIVHDGYPLPDVAVSIDGGRIRISGPMVALGYRLRPRETAAAFRPGSILTGDLGRVTDGRLAVTGRVDDVVKISGVTVSLVAVEEAARDVTGVVDAAAAILGPRDQPTLALALVCAPDAPDDLEAEVSSGIGARLGAPARPRIVARVAGLPVLPGGKIDRHAVGRLLGGRTDPPEG